MANDFTTFDQSKQNDFALTKNQKCPIRGNKLVKGKIVYKKDTGMAHRIANVSRANGIEHYNLICSETNSSHFLSKFALDSDYTEDSVNVEKFGLKMLKRLSEMWGK